MEIPWETEIDTPATIAIVGGGPIGIEAALYGRFLGYSVEIYTSHRVGSRLAKWGDIVMPAPVAQSTSSLGLAALQAQGTPCQLDPASTVTYGEYVAQYLIPVAKTDLIYDSIHIQHRVESIGRWDSRIVRHGDASVVNGGDDSEFRVLVSSQQRGQFSQLVDIVLDCSGLGSYRVGLAPGGSRAVGESAAAKLSSGLCSLGGKDRDAFAGKHTVLYGYNLEAAAFVDAFSRLAENYAGTRLTWIVPARVTRAGLPTIDGLPIGGGLSELFDRSNAVLRRDELPIVVQSAWGIEPVAFSDAESTTGPAARIALQLNAEETLTIDCDHLVNCANGLPDWRFADAVNTSPLGVFNGAESRPLESRIATNEPHYYVLGAKSLAGGFLSLADGLQQIRQAFGYIGGRAELDLYSTVVPQS